MHKRMSPHGDYDHMGEAINLFNNFKAEKVIFNCGEFKRIRKRDKKHRKYLNLYKKVITL